MSAGLSKPGKFRFRTNLQITRLLTYVLAGLLAGAFTLVEPEHRTSYAAMFLHIGIAVLSALLLIRYYSGSPSSRSMHVVDRLWLAFDYVWMGVAICITGGIDSTWYVWYIAPLAAAAFVLRPLEVVVMAVSVIAGYVVTIFFIEAVHGVDVSLFEPLQRIVFLIASATCLLIGIIDLRKKRRILGHLQLEQANKLEELARLNSALDQRTLELAQVSARLAAADAQKSRFLASISHELRTPLNSIIGFSAILQERIQPGGMRRLAVNIHDSGQHLLGLVNDILDLSRIEAGHMELTPEPVDLSELIDDVVMTMGGVSRARKVTLAFQSSLPVDRIDADPIKLKQVLYNVVSNAVKYSPEGETVMIAAKRLNAADNPLGVDVTEIRVVDRGAGVPARDQELIFDEFRKGSGKNVKAGTGLGLALARKFVELHGGSIRVASTPGMGSTFIVLLPICLRAGNASRNEPRIPPLRSDARPCVLVVEEDTANCDAIGLSLIACGYMPVLVRRGEDVLYYAQTLAPAAISVNPLNRDIDCRQLLGSLKECSLSAKIPIILLSFDVNRELRLALDIDDYFVKPAGFKDLVTRALDFAIHNSSVLILDGDPAVHDRFDEVFVPAGFRVRHATTCSSGHEMARMCPPDLVVLDILQEGTDGCAVAGSLMSDARTAGVPIIVYSEFQRTPEECRGPGMDDVTPASWNANSRSRLDAVVGGLLARQQARMRRRVEAL